MFSETYIGHRIGEVPWDATGWIPSVPNGSEFTEVDAYALHVGLFLDSAWGRARYELSKEFEIL
jgi:hypothetical protein